jgi:beta-glucosidase-like glycosyl hydrolase
MLTNDIGKLLFAGFPETNFTSDSQAAKLIRDHHVHCFMLYPHNYENIKQLKKLIDELQSFAYSINFSSPLIIALDNRMYKFLCNQNLNDLTHFPNYLALTATGKISLVFNIGKAIAIELRSIGFNMIIGPIMDICSKILLDVIGLNSFGITIEEVIKFGGSFTCGLKNGGILTSACHFPGIGESFIEPLSSTPIILDNYSQIENFNCKPFKKMIEHDLIDSILASIVFSPNALNDDLYCCLNPKIIDHLLRDKLKFDKLVISESLEFKEIFFNYGIGQAASLAIIHAHCDMITIPKNYNYQLEALEFLKKSFEHGNNQAILIIALRRIDEFLNKLSWFDSKIEIDNSLKLNHKELSSQAYKDSITLIRNLYDLIPLQNYLQKQKAEQRYFLLNSNSNSNYSINKNKILLFFPESLDSYSKVENDFIKLSKSIDCSVKSIYFTTDGITPSIQSDLNNCSIVIFFINDLNTNQYQISLIQQISNILHNLCKDLIVVSVDSPYYFISTENIGSTYICTYDKSYEAIRHIPQIIFNKYRSTGRVPGALNKFNNKEEVVMGLSNNLDGSEWQFDFLLNKTPSINKQISKLNPPTSLNNFENNIYTNQMLNLNDEIFTNDASALIDANQSQSVSSANTLFDTNYSTHNNGNNNKIEENKKNFNDQLNNEINKSSIINKSNNEINKSSISQSPELNDLKNSNNKKNMLNQSSINTVNFQSSKTNKTKEKPWVVEPFDINRDTAAFSMVKTNTINDVYYPIDNILLGKIWYFTEAFGDGLQSFVVRNPSMGSIHGIVAITIDEFEKCGRIIYMVVSKSKRRQGVGETLHRRAVQYITLERGCTTVALGCAFPFFNYLTPKVLNEISTVWHYLETKDDSKIDIDDSSIQLVGFYKSLGWSYTRHRKGVFQQVRKHLLQLNIKDWKFPGLISPINELNIQNSYSFIDELSKLNIKFLISDDSIPAFNLCHYHLKADKIKDDEEVMFTSMYSKVKLFIEEELNDFESKNKKRSTIIVYALIDNNISGSCIVYTSDSKLSFYYPLIETSKISPTDTIAGITGLFVGNTPSNITSNQQQQQQDKSPGIENFKDIDIKQKKLIKLGLISTSVEIINQLGIRKTLLHNVSREELDQLQNCGFEKLLEYCACFGRKKAFEWVV